MSEQSKILAELQALIMDIMKSGTVTPAEGEKLDALEAKLFKQKCFTDIDHEIYENIGENIAGLFFENRYDEAIDKLLKEGITPEDFFGFADYHFEEEDETEMFTQAFIAGVEEAYQAKSAQS